MDEAGAHLATGERGEVVIQGPSVVSGYENNPEANAKSYTNGWFRTGDQGFLDSDGYLTLTGRIKELINRGGEKIGPREIDEVLLGHPAVAEAVAFGVPHPTWGEEVAAAVVLREPADEAAILALLQRPAGGFQASQEALHHHLHSAHRYRQNPARRSGQGSDGGIAMRFLIAGAGAIGGYLGACLARAGQDVTLFARGPHLRAMEERGLAVLSAGGDFQVHPKVTGDLAQADPADVIVLGVKAHSLTQLAPRLQPLIGADTTVVSTQNGIPWWYFQAAGGRLPEHRLERVDPGGMIGAAIHPARVVGSLVYLATEIASPA